MAEASQPPLRLRTDSPAARRIVLAFLDFLSSVELAPGADSEALEVTKDCLQSLFGLDSSFMEQGIRPGLLMGIFEALEQHNLRSDSVPETPQINKSPNSSSIPVSKDPEKFKGESTAQQIRSGLSGDEIFARFYAGLDKANFFKVSSNGVEDSAQISKATQIFDVASEELRNSGKSTPSLDDFAEAFKSKGNQLMQLSRYSEAVELYTCAIALHGRNAIYHCNRAAAYTHLCRYTEAIDDCMRSIEIDPNYSKAYSRLGSAYFALGNYHDAFYKGYKRACELDPNNQGNIENAQVALRKLREQQNEHAQSSTSSPSGAPNSDFIASILEGVTSVMSQQSGAHSVPSSNGAAFSSFSTNTPIDLTNILGSINFTSGPNPQAAGSNDHTPPFASHPMNFSFAPGVTNPFASAAAASTGGHPNHGEPPNASGGHSSEPSVQADVHAAFAEAPEQVTHAIRSVMQMFLPQSGPQDGMPPGQGHS